MKKMLILLAILTTIVFASAVFADDDVIRPEEADYYVGAEEAGRFEGAGYDTPEEAISAYTQALKNKDLDGIISTFAVETYVDNFDVVKNIERLSNSWSDSSNMGLNGGVYISGTMQRELSIYMRVGDIVEAVQYQHARLSNSLVWFGKGEVHTYRASEDEIGDTAEKMAAAIYPEETDYIYDELQLGDVLTFNQMCIIVDEMTGRDFGDEANLKKIDEQHRALNMEDYQIVAQILSIGDHRFVFTGGAVKYNERWYMNEVSSQFAYFIGASPFSYGIIPVGESEYSEYFTYIPDEVLDKALAATLEGSVYISNDNEYYNEALGIQCIVPPSWIVMDLNDAFFEETPQMISYEFVAMESNMDAGNMNLIEVYRMELPEEVLMLMKYLDMTELMSLMKDSIGNGLGLAMEPSQIEVVGNLEFPLEDYGCIRFEGDVDEMDFNGAAVFSIIDSYMYGFVVGNANMYGNAENHPEELFQYFSAISGEYSS